MQSKVVWRDGLAFDAHLDGHTFIIDADATVGGRDQGPKPKGLTVTSLVGCTGMDVISILTKMRVKPDSFEVIGDAVLTGQHPKRFTEITVRYVFTGQDLPLDRLRKAVRLSEDRYCGVSATLKPVVDLRSEIYVNGELIPA